MPLDPRVQRFLALLSAGNADQLADKSLEHRRAGLAELMRLGSPAAPIAEIQDRSLPGSNGPLMLRIYTPLDAPAGPLAGLVYFHGGGFVAGSIATHDLVARRLTQQGRCRVISVDYRLAPEHPFPAALEDAIQSVSYIAAHAESFGIDPERLGICGDSAGAALAAATCRTLSEIDGPSLILQLLICPILDFSRRSSSRQEFASGYLIEEHMIERDLQYYVPAGTDLSQPRLSPLRAESLAGLPPTIVHTAEFDPFRDEGKEYYDRLDGLDSALSYTCHVGMIHLFYALGAVIPHAQSAFEQIGMEIRAVLKT